MEVLEQSSSPKCQNVCGEATEVNHGLLRIGIEQRRFYDDIVALTLCLTTNDRRCSTLRQRAVNHFTSMCRE